jgi:hypothetical protein
MKAASWLMTRVGVDESLIGDLAEQVRAGRSVVWLWRQTVVAIVTKMASTAERDPAVLGVAGVVMAAAFAFPYTWTHFLWRFALVVDNAWYPRTFNWFAHASPQALWQMVVFLHPWAWTYTAGWCVSLGVIAWWLVGLWPNRADLVIAIFVLSNASQCLPYLGRSFLDCVHEPTNAIWISDFVWYACFVFVAMPLSILVGGRIDAWRSSSRRLTT